MEEWKYPDWFNLSQHELFCRPRQGGKTTELAKLVLGNSKKSCLVTFNKAEKERCEKEYPNIEVQDIDTLLSVWPSSKLKQYRTYVDNADLLPAYRLNILNNHSTIVAISISDHYMPSPEIIEASLQKLKGLIDG